MDSSSFITKDVYISMHMLLDNLFRFIDICMQMSKQMPSSNTDKTMRLHIPIHWQLQKSGYKAKW